MRTIVVDDEPIMLRKFERMSRSIEEIELVGSFRDPAEAIAFMKESPAELAFLDIGMPVMNGLQLAAELKKLREDLLIVFVTAYDEYIREANAIGSDYYMMKPYELPVLEKTVKNMALLSQRQRKPVCVQMFGRFTVMKNGQPVALTGKAKEILALLVARQGKEISNEEIFVTVWEDREYSHDSMKTYFNVLKRLKDVLRVEGISGLLISTPHGQLVDTSLFDCDYYDFKANRAGAREAFEGEFLVEYSWGEGMLGSLMEEYFLL